LKRPENKVFIRREAAGRGPQKLKEIGSQHELVWTQEWIIADDMYAYTPLNLATAPFGPVTGITRLEHKMCRVNAHYCGRDGGVGG
jgi:hypothetical protein